AVEAGNRTGVNITRGRDPRRGIHGTTPGRKKPKLERRELPRPGPQRTARRRRADAGCALPRSKLLPLTRQGQTTTQARRTALQQGRVAKAGNRYERQGRCQTSCPGVDLFPRANSAPPRSEARRVGTECSTGRMGI